ncbi:glycosyltransferase WbsX family protein [Streptococcus porcinus]
MVEYIAFYLPQFHPVPENDKWYGKGFTEWMNVAKAKPLYLNHYQPHVPADLGFYDLRVKETRQEQARLAKDYGLSAFCYWNYWFGDGVELLQNPIREVYNDKEIDFPFCLGWANHSWEKKQWDKKGSNELLVEQKYLGVEDYKKYFYTYLDIFKDERYYKVEDKLFFVIYSPLADEEIVSFINTWRDLAKKEGLSDFYFVGKDMSGINKDKILSIGVNAVFEDNTLNIHHELNFASKILQLIKRKVFRRPTVFKYKEAIKYMIDESAKDENVIPVVAPNWDHSPRSGNNAMILDDAKPKYFAKLLKETVKTVNPKPKSKQQVIIKSWNEWGEGNHLEPDLKYGRGYLEAVKKSIEEVYD